MIQFYEVNDSLSNETVRWIFQHWKKNVFLGTLLFAPRRGVFFIFFPIWLVGVSAKMSWGWESLLLRYNKFSQVAIVLFVLFFFWSGASLGIRPKPHACGGLSFPGGFAPDPRSLRSQVTLPGLGGFTPPHPPAVNPCYGFVAVSSLRARLFWKFLFFRNFMKIRFVSNSPCSL